MRAIRSTGSRAFKKSNSHGKCTKATAQARVNQCYRWISECKGRPAILQLGSDQWGVSERQIDDYIKKARDQIQVDWSIDRKEYVAQLAQKLERVAENSLASGQNSNAIGAYGLQARILGIDGKS